MIMGFFSWYTSDTHTSISNRYSVMGALPVYLLCPDGTKIYEDNYDGYGRFGGYDIFTLLAKWNAPEKVKELEGDEEEIRMLGIALTYDGNCKDNNANLKYPIKIVENPNIRYEFAEPAKPDDEHQGYFYDYEEEYEEE